MQLILFYVFLIRSVFLQVLGAVNDKESLGNKLLLIVGQRMKTILNDSNIELKERLSNLSPSVTTWIQDQVSMSFICYIINFYFALGLVLGGIPVGKYNCIFMGMFNWTHMFHFVYLNPPAMDCLFYLTFCFFQFIILIVLNPEYIM